MIPSFRQYSVFLFIVCFTLCCVKTEAQCISRFPYTENFQTSNGGWKAGGTASDWAWGAVQKSVIFNAGNTNKCWVVGGLTGNYYNENEKSWLQGPCFDFTGLQNPFISLLLNWDTEKGFDGAALQYSVDNGSNWESAGAFGDPSTGCTDNHWFNSAFISLGMQAEGWSGSNSNGGSLGWVKAYHSFPKLAGQPNVTFRFVFGAGKVKNDFNGFAVDDIYVGETETDKLSFTYTCLASPKSVAFSAADNGCFVTSSLQWNFDDISSGAGNTANGNNVQHVFSSPGEHTIILTGKDNRNQTVISTQTIIIPDVSATIASPILCNGKTGTLQAYVLNMGVPVSYIWSTTPVLTTPTIQAQAGIYTVTASVDGGCSNSAEITLTEPPPLTHAIQTTPADCNNRNGTISITESGGTTPYQYAWQGTQFTASSANDLPAGNYSITVTDRNLCADKINVALPLSPSTLSQNITTNSPDCGLSNGSITVTADGGNAGYTYEWTPDVSAGREALNIPSGNYTVITTDINSCRDTAIVTLADKSLSVSLGNDTVICKGQTLLLKPVGDYASYLWNDGSTLPSKTVSGEGYSFLKVTNAGGCTASDTIRISTGCGDLVFPSVFTPNGDGRNEQFGPSGGLSLVSSYQLQVYNRFGNLVFRSVNPYQKWNGDMNGIKLTGTYTYVATYKYENVMKTKKGTIVLFL